MIEKSPMDLPYITNTFKGFLEATEGGRLVRFNYGGCFRVAYPHMVGSTAHAGVVAHCLQVGGFTSDGELDGVKQYRILEEPEWKYFYLHNAEQLEFLPPPLGTDSGKLSKKLPDLYRPPKFVLEVLALRPEVLPDVDVDPPVNPRSSP